MPTSHREVFCPCAVWPGAGAAFRTLTPRRPASGRAAEATAGARAERPGTGACAGASTAPVFSAAGARAGRGPPRPPGPAPTPPPCPGAAASRRLVSRRLWVCTSSQRPPRHGMSSSSSFGHHHSDSKSHLFAFRLFLGLTWTSILKSPESYRAHVQLSD